MKILPVCRDVRSNLSNSGWFSISINMVGVPYRDVHLNEREEVCFK